MYFAPLLGVEPSLDFRLRINSPVPHLAARMEQNTLLKLVTNVVGHTTCPLFGGELNRNIHSVLAMRTEIESA